MYSHGTLKIPNFALSVPWPVRNKIRPRLQGDPRSIWPFATQFDCDLWKTRWKKRNVDDPSDDSIRSIGQSQCQSINLHQHVRKSTTSAIWPPSLSVKYTIQLLRRRMQDRYRHTTALCFHFLCVCWCVLRYSLCKSTTPVAWALGLVERGETVRLRIWAEQGKTGASVVALAVTVKADFPGCC